MKIIWTVSNLLSLFRLFLAIPIYYFLSNEMPGWTIFTILFASLTDIADGYLARMMHQVTEFGKVIDPLADKVCVFAVAFGLLLQDKIPLWFFLVIFSKDIIILIGGLLITHKSNVVPPSNWAGKAAVVSTGITFLLIILNQIPHTIIFVLIILSTCLIILSFYLYLKKFIVEFRK